MADQPIVEVNDVINILLQTDMGKALWERAQYIALSNKQSQMMTQLEAQILATKSDPQAEHTSRMEMPKNHE